MAVFKTNLRQVCDKMKLPKPRERAGRTQLQSRIKIKDIIAPGDTAASVSTGVHSSYLS